MRDRSFSKPMDGLNAMIPASISRSPLERTMGTAISEEEKAAKAIAIGEGFVRGFRGENWGIWVFRGGRRKTGGCFYL